MRQIRSGVFETNSSSTHSLTLCMKSDFDKWKKGEAWRCQWVWCTDYIDENVTPKRYQLYSKHELLFFMKQHLDYLDTDWNNKTEVESRFQEFIKEGFISYIGFENEYYEYYEDTFVTPAGETVVAFGECKG